FYFVLVGRHFFAKFYVVLVGRHSPPSSTSPSSVDSSSPGSASSSALSTKRLRNHLRSTKFVIYSNHKAPKTTANHSASSPKVGLGGLDVPLSSGIFTPSVPPESSLYISSQI
ncbi:unnamed protein product, partial [Scytosiphon promiscuus]